MIRPIHPFPARMAPELAVAELRNLSAASVVLDPMAGSGTVLRHATDLGHRALGFDMDPLAVLMAQVWTTPVEDGLVSRLAASVAREAARTVGSAVSLPWIDEDEPTRLFVDYWFAEQQRDALRRLSRAISDRGTACRGPAHRAAVNVLRIALSRIIITKDQGASLARDVSHSRPHKVADSSEFDVVAAFARSVDRVRNLLVATPPRPGANVRRGDARMMDALENRSVDVVLTSPPYLNAIDYMRGHRLSLVWLGYRLSDLRSIRSNSIGAERGPDVDDTEDLFTDIRHAICAAPDLSRRHSRMIERFAEDVYRLMSEIARVLKPDGRAILVVGNSCLNGIFVRNSDGVTRAAAMVGLRLVRSTMRDLPDRHRYLPMPSGNELSLAKRMRTETILSFTAA